MAIRLPDEFDRDDVEHYVQESVAEAEKSLQDQIDTLQQYVEALEGAMDADRGELKRVGDIADRLDS